MEAGLSPARQARVKHRHELRTLTYVTLDQADVGIVRNLNHEGIGVQAVAALRLHEQLRVRFELRNPRLRVETRGEVTWSTASGQCGIRFLDLPPRMVRQINEWIFGNLLEGISHHAERAGLMFGWSPLCSPCPDIVGEEDGLIVSAAPVKVLELRALTVPAQRVAAHDYGAEAVPQARSELDWLSQPLSGRALAWTVNSLVVVAALLLFVLVFLSVTGAPPQRPLTMLGGAVLFVAGLYWGFFQLFGRLSPGKRLARSTECDRDQEEAKGDRFR